MSNKKSTKRALLGSVMAMALCLAMLIGTTFAWFTDSASTGVNTVQSGTLDVQLVDEQGNEITGPLTWKTNDNRDQDKILWEPGAEYQLSSFKIKNNGNLALKYKIEITGIDGDAKLNEVITWTYKVGEATPADLSEEGHLVANTMSDLITIFGKMDESAGNDYQELSIDGISITVVATQDTVEYDSSNKTYDATAEYPAINAAELKTALAAGGVVAINDDIKVDESKTTAADRIIIKQPTTLNLDAKLVVPGELEPTANWAALYINADTVLNATENGGIQCLDKTDGSSGGPYVAHIAGDINVTVNGGTYYGGGTIFNVQSGTLTINGGHFEITPFGDPYGYNFMINCIDANYQNGTAKIVVKGGTFVNFNPADNAAEGAGTNFVAEGYTVTSETKDNGETWYTVVPE